MATDGVTLGQLKSSVTSIMSASEGSLKTMLSSISNGDTVTNADLLAYQMELASNSLTATICSAVAKERADTCKSIVQKFG